MTGPTGVIGALEENQVSRPRVCFGHPGALAQNPVGSGAREVMDARVGIDPADKNGAVEAGTRGRTAPHIGEA